MLCRYFLAKIKTSVPIPNSMWIDFPLSICSFYYMFNSSGVTHHTVYKHFPPGQRTWTHGPFAMHILSIWQFLLASKLSVIV